MNKISLTYFTNKAIIMYLALLLLAPMLFGYPMEWFGYVWGIVAVVLFFSFCNVWFQSSKKENDKLFTNKLYWISFGISFVYICLSYWFYTEMTDQPFEFSASDSTTYHKASINALEYMSNGGSFFSLLTLWQSEFSDSGYLYVNTILYWLITDSPFVVRLANVIIGAFIPIYVYRISSRHFNQNISRISAVFCALYPYFIIYCGLHLKEITMTFLSVLFINSADVIVMENNKWQKWIPLVLSGLSLFMFRTVLGAVAFLSFFATLLFSGRKTMSWGKRVLIIFAALIVSFFAASDKIIDEVQQTWDAKDKNQQISMEWRSKRKGGNEFAKYAGAAVFAPLIFTIPFPSIVYTEGQENMRMTNGANYVKNIMSFFTIYAIVMLILSGEWKNNVLVLSFTLGYLVVIAFSAFAQSGRFHIPVMPFEMMLSAYGVCMVKYRHRKYVNMWFVVMFVACLAWQWFKLAGRGMI